jgi:hypothetical protein
MGKADISTQAAPVSRDDCEAATRSTGPNPAQQRAEAVLTEAVGLWLGKIFLESLSSAGYLPHLSEL